MSFLGWIETTLQGERERGGGRRERELFVVLHLPFIVYNNITRVISPLMAAANCLNLPFMCFNNVT